MKNRRIVWASYTSIAVLVAVVCYLVVRPSGKLAKYQSLYEMVDKSYMKQDVIKLFGQPEMVLWSVHFWDNDKLPDEEVKRVVESIAYCVPSFYLDTCFGFSFDKNGRIVGKHRYD